MLKNAKTGLAWCVLGPICAIFILTACPFLLIAWADNYLTTRNMTPEELEKWRAHKRFLSNGDSGRAYDVV